MKYFKIEEFACPDCHRATMNEDFLNVIDLARDYAGIPFIITSGFRCKEHNKEIGGKPNSAHLRGLAADIKAIDSYTRGKILQAINKVILEKNLPYRIGIARTFIHWDIDPYLPNPRVWLYNRR